MFSATWQMYIAVCDDINDVIRLRHSAFILEQLQSCSAILDVFLKTSIFVEARTRSFDYKEFQAAMIQFVAPINYPSGMSGRGSNVIVTYVRYIT